MQRHSARQTIPWLAAAVSLVATSPLLPALAQTPAPPSIPDMWTDTLKFSLQIEGGIMGNTASPGTGSGGNFGHLFTDKANDFLLNQILATITRPLDPKATGYDFGFKLQGMFGTDARYTRWYNFATGQTSRYQADLVEANVLVHTPWLTSGGIDFKAGMFTTPLGAETIDPSTNVFYSHSYIFNFGLPLKHTGVLATAHITSMVDLYAGVDSGVNTTLGPYKGDNNSSYSFLGGVGLNLMGGDLTILALTHIGPENTGQALAPGGAFVPLANRSNRYYGDIVLTWKATPDLTLISEANIVHDELPGVTPTAFGFAQYATYAINEQLSVSARAEIFRDDKNFFVAAFPGNNDFNNAFSGRPTGPLVAAQGSNTTYGSITLGVTYKPALSDFNLPGVLMIRPEIRYDTALTGNKPYNGGKDSGAFTIGSDFVLTF
jgi:hypothetical protein